MPTSLPDPLTIAAHLITEKLAGTPRGVIVDGQKYIHLDDVGEGLHEAVRGGVSLGKARARFPAFAAGALTGAGALHLATRRD